MNVMKVLIRGWSCLRLDDILVVTIILTLDKHVAE